MKYSTELATGALVGTLLPIPNGSLEKGKEEVLESLATAKPHNSPCKSCLQLHVGGQGGSRPFVCPDILTVCWKCTRIQQGGSPPALYFLFLFVRKGS